MAETKPKRIAVITGSTRIVRIGPEVAKFVTRILETELSSPAGGETADFTLSQVDIATFNLPVFDEAVHPAQVPIAAQFAHTHSKAWSAEIAKYDGYVLVTACYNGGPPGRIKNAIDYLYNEIRGKPWLIISYGIMGGYQASDSLKTSLETMYTHVVETRPTLSFAKNEPFEFGLPLDMRLAGAGKLGDQSLKDWQEKKSDIARGFEELKEYLMREKTSSA
jgi:NAD(P)H-dependent FMN reductase